MQAKPVEEQAIDRNHAFVGECAYKFYARIYQDIIYP